MAVPTPDWKIAVGHYQVGTLVRWNSILVSGAYLFDPGDPPPHTMYNDELVVSRREDESLGFHGFPLTVWTIPIMTVAQYEYLKATYQGKLVTVRDTTDGLSFANYNATFKLASKPELAGSWDLFGSDPPGVSGFAGEQGWYNVPITISAMRGI